ncbi:histidinol-phosphatase (PHP family) [Cladophialophora yegresii CBS 114405]|uniref:Histidinol-phosphatase n=1 Tax=Cladophialophora yegresii CBS 114405 TaxID=1182544 RepID=W9VQY6_9EURO|nr:histidinol-phosphatase (PHP family) [Cladophialophora yegresii CBS 114405]EXJ58147.1 histidinol-phosphatase (PHP family) [Cladophialophora yegresii CBS 114405]
MPHSHHSHSGQFCPGHARDSLESIVQHAISRQMTVFALTEHMPRHDLDRYPEEVGTTLEQQLANEEAYIKEAHRLRGKYKSQIQIPIGFEAEWIRPESQELIEASIQKHPYDFFIGSVHHVHTVPIDYDHEVYRGARSKAGGTDERLFEDYFDAQYAMLKAVKPPVVGHFDLIRLKSDDPNACFESMQGVWSRIQRNLDLISGYGGILEINSSAVRKGMHEPYPKAEICQAALARKIRFCLSDDSHGIDQIAHSYGQVLQFLDKMDIRSVTFLKHCESPGATEKKGSTDERFPNLQVECLDVKELKETEFRRFKKTA